MTPYRWPVDLVVTLILAVLVGLAALWIALTSIYHPFANVEQAPPVSLSRVAHQVICTADGACVLAATQPYVVTRGDLP